MNDLIEQGIQAYRAGNRPEARKHFVAAIKNEPNNEKAWGYLYQVSDTDKEKIHCLKQILRINPANAKAKDMLEKLTVVDFPFDQEASASNQTSSNVVQPTPSQKIASVSMTPTASAGLDGISTIMIVMLIILAIFWIGIGLLQMSAFSGSNAFCTGTWNILISIVNLLGIGNIVKRSKRVPNEMMFLAVVGSLFGIVQLFSGVYLQACVIPLYIALGVLANINKNVYVN